MFLLEIKTESGTSFQYLELSGGPCAQEWLKRGHSFPYGHNLLSAHEKKYQYKIHSDLKKVSFQLMLASHLSREQVHVILIFDCNGKGTAVTPLKDEKCRVLTREKPFSKKSG